MTILKYHAVPAGSECRISSQKRTPAQPPRRLARVGSNALLAFLFLMLFAGVDRSEAKQYVLTNTLTSSDPNPSFGEQVTFTVTLTNNTGFAIANGYLFSHLYQGYLNVAVQSSSPALPAPTVAQQLAGDWYVQIQPFSLLNGETASMVITAEIGPGTIAAGHYLNTAQCFGSCLEVPVNESSVEPDGYISAPGDVLTLVYDPVDGREEIHDALGNEMASLVTDWDAYSGGLFVVGQDLLVDYSGSPVFDPIPADGITFQGAGTSASMTLDGNVGGVSITDMEFLFDNENDGSIVIDGETISYLNLKPINDFLVAASKSFDYTGVLSPVFHTITLNQGTVLNDGLSFIDCANCGEEVTFLNPTVDLTITGGDGDNTVCEGDHIIAGKLDLPLAPTFVNMFLNGGDGEDLFTVTPKSVDDIWVDGGTPNTGGVACVCGDRLDLDLTGITTADLDVVNAATGTGIWTFNAPYLPVHFTNIEGHLDADVAVNVDVTPDIAYATDFLDVVITVTNTGADMATCASVIIPATLLKIFSEDGFAVTPVLAYFDENGNAVGALGSYTAIDSTWTINGLDAGYSATFTLTGLVSNFQLMPEEFPITAASNGSTSMVVFETSPGFQFPLTTFVNAATFHTAYYEDVPTWNDLGTVITLRDISYDHLIVGLFQGAPGITGAVWCKVPELIDFLAGGDDQVVWPGDNYFGVVGGEFPATGSETNDPPPASLGDLWRPCSGTMGDVTVDVDPLVPNVQPSIALPFPLHVNDLFVDDMMTPGDPTDDVIYLATWGSAGLYKSYDGGHTWSAAWPELGPGDASMGVYWTNIYAITRDAAGFLYASANDGYIIRSLNHGAVWQVVGPLPYADADTPWALEADINNAGVVYAGTFGRGVLCTDDYGYNWDVLDNPLTVANENTILYSAPNNAGHIFDFAIADDGADRYLFVATGKGVWRARVASNGSCGLLSAWQFIGPEVKLADNTVVRPEVHALALLADGVLDPTLDGTVDLLAGLWGNFLVGGDLISSFKFEDPFAIPVTPIYEPYQLKGVQIESFAVSPSGQLAAITNRGLKFFDPGQASTSTASESVETSEIPTEFALEQNYPNPFNPVTTIRYSVAESAKVRLAVYDVLGRQVALLADGLMQAGQHEVRFDAANLPSGTYLYRLQTPVGSYSKTLVLMK